MLWFIVWAYLCSFIVLHRTSCSLSALLWTCHWIPLCMQNGTLFPRPFFLFFLKRKGKNEPCKPAIDIFPLFCSKHFIFLVFREHNIQFSDVSNEETSWLLQLMSQKLVISFLDLCIVSFFFLRLSSLLQSRFENKDFCFFKVWLQEIYTRNLDVMEVFSCSTLTLMLKSNLLHRLIHLRS